MRAKQQQFYTQVGIRQPEQLTRPRLIPIKKLTLPLQSIYLFNPDNQAVVGPNTQDPLLLGLTGRVFVEHVTALLSEEGGPRRTVINPDVLVSDFRRKNRLFKPLRKDNALTINQQNVLVENFAMLNPLYRYIVSYKACYYRWKNHAATFWKTVARLHERFNWNMYLEVALPERIPELSAFNKLQTQVSQDSLEAFSTTATLNAFDLFQWLGSHRSESNLATLSPDALRNVNLLFRVKTHFFVLNLKQLDDWRKDPETQKGGNIAAGTLQRRFLVLLHGLRDLQTGITQLDNPTKDGGGELKITDLAERKGMGVDPTETPLGEEPAAVVDEGPEQEDAARDEDVNALPDLDLGLDTEPPAAPKNDSQLADDPDDTVEDEEQVLPNVTPDDEELDALEAVQRADSTDHLVRGIIDRAWELSELGLISPRAYNRAVADANSFKELPDPFGSDKTIAEQMVITAQDLSLPEEVTYPDRDTIIDKSMLSSKLQGMQKKYVRNLMTKDILNAVIAQQQQGVAIKGYEIETVRDTMNHYQIHSVTLKPLRGRQSTIRFRLPVVDADGRFISNGVTYRMRLQRADKPIRKINATRVALTSYYNKTFVDRSQRTVNDYDRWLCSLITSKGMNPDDPSITDLRYGELKDTEVELPRIYTLLAKRFRSFVAGSFVFFFDYPHRAEFFTGVDLAKVETAGMTAIGRAEQAVLLVDSNNTIYRHSPAGLEVLGTLTDLLGIDTSRAPVEAAEMTVANKVLPVGFVLGYQLGLSELIRLLGAEVSRHRRGERLSVGPDDYTLVFQDEVLVFSKHDYRATMILSGLNRYHRQLKQFSVWDFDKQDVYYRLLEEQKLGIRYLREINALFQAWVDPITRGLLEAMGEPTEFAPLLIRAVELLMTDYAPDEVDGAFMRYRGYERFAGMVYGELARAVKVFNARAASGEHAVELNPHQVWQKIVQDPAIGAVEESNPFANLREQEATTYRGDGGRSGTSMVERTRIYHKNDLGVVSESTVDSGDVGVVAYLAPDANFTDMRGFTRGYDPTLDGASKLLSSAALNAPCAEHDDSKRINKIVPLDREVY